MDRNAGIDEVPQQVAVIARRLDDNRAFVETQPVGDQPRKAGRMVEPARRVRGEVGVVGEDLRGRHNRFDLHQEALRADTRVQWIARLAALCKLLAGRKGVCERLLAQVDERVAQAGAAGKARWELGQRSASYAAICPRLRLRAS